MAHQRICLPLNLSNMLCVLASEGTAMDLARRASERAVLKASTDLQVRAIRTSD